MSMEKCKMEKEWNKILEAINERQTSSKKPPNRYMRKLDIQADETFKQRINCALSILAFLHKKGASNEVVNNFERIANTAIYRPINTI